MAPTSDVGARLGAEYGRLVNVSATGALVRTRVSFLAGRQCPLVLNLSDSPAKVSVRIVRTQLVSVDLPGAISRIKEYLVAVMFVGLSSSAKDAVETLCGSAFVRTE